MVRHAPKPYEEFCTDGEVVQSMAATGSMPQINQLLLSLVASS